jgi:hypothetical protein
MKIVSRCVGLALILGSLFPLTAGAQNTTPANAAPIGVGQFPVFPEVGPSASDQRWYWTDGFSGRSYCASVAQGVQSYYPTNTKLTVYRQDGTTEIGNNDDARQEPSLFKGSRVCWMTPAIAGASELVLFKIEPSPAASLPWSGSREGLFQVVETTMWSSWFFIAGDYNAFILLRNTTKNSVNYVAVFRDAANVNVGSCSGTLVGSAALALNAKACVTDPTTNVNGSVEVFHNGTPGALIGQMTSLSATTGVGFDAPFFTRPPW